MSDSCDGWLVGAYITYNHSIVRMDGWMDGLGRSVERLNILESRESSHHMHAMEPHLKTFFCINYSSRYVFTKEHISFTLWWKTIIINFLLLSETWFNE